MDAPRCSRLGCPRSNLAFLVTWGDAMTILLMIGVLVATSFALGYLLGYETSRHGHQWKP